MRFAALCFRVPIQRAVCDIPRPPAARLLHNRSPLRLALPAASEARQSAAKVPDLTALRPRAADRPRTQRHPPAHSEAVLCIRFPHPLIAREPFPSVRLRSPMCYTLRRTPASSACRPGANVPLTRGDVSPAQQSATSTTRTISTRSGTSHSPGVHTLRTLRPFSATSISSISSVSSVYSGTPLRGTVSQWERVRRSPIRDRSQPRSHSQFGISCRAHETV